MQSISAAGRRCCRSSLTVMSILLMLQEAEEVQKLFNEGLWQKVIDDVKPGDYVFIQFAHNDEKNDTVRGTKPWGEYYSYLKLLC